MTPEQEQRYYALLDQGYSPADASMMARVQRFHGPNTPRREAKREPEPLEFTRPSEAELARGRHIDAAAATQWAMRWRTWPEGGNAGAAFEAALAALNSNPTLDRFEVAKVAITAARRWRRPTRPKE